MTISQLIADCQEYLWSDKKPPGLTDSILLHIISCPRCRVRCIMVPNTAQPDVCSELMAFFRPKRKST